MGINSSMEELYKSFEPMLTPKEMIRMGVFGGTYFSKLDKEKRL